MRTESSKTYEEMTPVERKIEIAQDVVDQLQLEALPNVGSAYLSGGISKRIATKKGFLTESDVRSIQKSCKVCARGALMISRIAKFDRVKIDKLYPYKEIDGYCLSIAIGTTTDLLEGSFTRDELEVIDETFEGTGNQRSSEKIFHSDHVNEIENDWNEDVAGRRNLLMAICQNIVDHGTFRPLVRYDIIEGA